MKVLHVIDSGGVYGAERMLLELVGAHRRMGIDSAIASIGRRHEAERPLEQEARRRGFVIEPFRMVNGPNFAGMWRIIRFARRNGFQLLHCHGYKANILVGFTPSAVRGMPVITTVHGWTTAAGVSKMGLYRWLDQRSLKRFTRVVFVSRSLAGVCESRLGRKGHSRIIPNGIPPGEDRGGSWDDERLAAYMNRFLVVGIGRLSPEKGFEDLVRAVAVLVGKRLDIGLLIVGEGPERRHLLTRVRRCGLEGHASLPGYRRDVQSVLRRADVFVLCSVTEGFPLSVLEAIQNRIPVVATAVGGVPEIIEHEVTGLLVRSRDVYGIAGAIERLYHDRDLGRRLSDAALHVFHEKYTTQKMAEEYARTYREVLDTPGSGGTAVKSQARVRGCC